MRYLRNNHIIRAIFATLILGVLTAGIISIATMNHSVAAMSVSCPVAMSAGDCSQSSESSACIDYHLGIIQNLSNAIPQSFGMGLFILMFATLLAFAVSGLLSYGHLFYQRLKIRFKQFLEETLEVFQDQLGFWLTIIQKRDPSYTFAMV